MRLLDLGCGTGAEAIALAARDIHILAVDPSEGMLEIARRNARDRGLSDRIELVLCAAHEIGDFLAGMGPFDGAYASFSLAYEADLAHVAADLHGLLRPRARFLASVPNRVDPVEWSLALLSVKPGLAGRRLRPWHPHRVGERSAPIRTYTVHSFSQALKPYFRIERVEGLATIVPPPYMNQAFARLRAFAETIERIDARVASWPGFRSLGDHFLATSIRADSAT